MLLSSSFLRTDTIGAAHSAFCIGSMIPRLTNIPFLYCHSLLTSRGFTPFTSPSQTTTSAYPSSSSILSPLLTSQDLILSNYLFCPLLLLLFSLLCHGLPPITHPLPPFPSPVPYLHSLLPLLIFIPFLILTLSILLLY